MRNFTIRVYLHTGEQNPAVYQQLDTIMHESGVRNTITSDGGRIYKLPPGEYNYTGEIDRKMLLEKVKAAAGEMGDKYSVLITESKGRTWFNLRSSI